MLILSDDQMLIVPTESDLWVTFSLVTLGLACFVGIILYFLIEAVRKRHLASRAFGLFGCIVGCFLIWTSVVVGSHENDGDFLKIISRIFTSVVKSFTQFGETEVPRYFSTLTDWQVQYFRIAITISEVICALVFYFSIITVVIRTIIAYVWDAFSTRLKKKDRLYIFTDLPYSELDDFIERQRKAGHKITIFFNQDDNATQEGSESRMSYLHHRFPTKLSSANERYIASHCHTFLRSKKIYGIYKSPKRNVAFADLALKTCRRLEKKPKWKQWMYRYKFYIADYDNSLDDKYNYNNASNGRISVFNEYDWVSTSYIFHNPAYRVMEMKEGQKYHVVFLGFGNINPFLLKKLVPNYFLPSDSRSPDYPEVDFTIYDQKLEDLTQEEKKELLYGYFPATRLYDEAQKGIYLPQYRIVTGEEKDGEDSLRIDLNGGDIESDSFLRGFVKSLVDSINRGEQTSIMVALGSSYLNFTIASKLRLLLQQERENGNLTLSLKNNTHKNVIINTYIREQDLFAPDYYDYDTEPKNKKAIEAKRRYVFDINKETYQELSSDKKEAKREKITVKERRNLWKQEDFPIVTFGRGGYYPDEEQEKISEMARASAFIYARVYNKDMLKKPSSYLLPSGNEVYVFTKNQINKQWKNDTVLNSVAKSNFYLTASLPNKVRAASHFQKDKSVDFRLEPVQGRKWDEKENGKYLDILQKDYIPYLEDPNAHRKYFTREYLHRKYDEIYDTQPSLKKTLNLLGIGYLGKGPDVDYIFNYREIVLHGIAEKLHDWVLKNNQKPINTKCTKKALFYYYRSSDFYKTVEQAINTNQDNFNDLILAAYLMNCTLLETEAGEMLAKAEHSRWYFAMTNIGTLPKKKDLFLDEASLPMSSGTDHNTSLKAVNGCMTTYRGLKQMEAELVRLLPLRYAFLISDFMTKTERTKESFAIDYPNFNAAMLDVHSLCYQADTFSLAELETILGRRKKEGKPLIYQDYELQHYNETTK